MPKKKKPVVHKLLTDGRQQYQNPNRVKRAKVNIWPDQYERLNKLGPNKHRIVRELLASFFKKMDAVEVENKVAAAQVKANKGASTVKRI